jgi:hypothetical protein
MRGVARRRGFSGPAPCPGRRTYPDRKGSTIQWSQVWCAIVLPSAAFKVPVVLRDDRVLPLNYAAMVGAGLEAGVGMGGGGAGIRTRTLGRQSRFHLI